MDSFTTGLLDGGATNALRQGSAEEIVRAVPVTVELAAGSAQLYQCVETGTLLSAQPVEPIVPLRGLVNLGYRIKWDSKGCLIYHDVVGHMKCWLRNGCPVVKETHALALIHDLEAYERNKRLGPRLAGESVSEEVGGHNGFPKFLQGWSNTWLVRMPSLKVRICHGIVGFVAGLPMLRV